ncbi:MAG: TrkH family potassium uptake protein [Duodenibacillus sp.]|nr:TrkH family potassium uptake protein [Duodenibacillus sp.]
MLATLRYLLFPVLNITGPVLAAFSLVMLIPAMVSLHKEDGVAYAFVIGALLSAVTGLVFHAVSKRDKRELVPRDGFLLTTLIWVAVPFFAAVPMYICVPGLSFTHAMFEAMSGVTTTCATIFGNLDGLPDTINFWRCLICWLGGMGILVLAVAILPLLGVGGAQIFKAESSGPMKESRLTPRIADTAKGLWWLYFGVTLACVFALKAAGLPTFEAIVHAFTTVSLGGFSSHDLSYGYFDSLSVELVAGCFMLFSGMSYSLHFLAWNRRSVLHYFRDVEARCWLAAAAAAVAAVTAVLVAEGTYPAWQDALRHAFFNVVSVISTSGFASEDFAQWPVAAPMLMMLFACFATCGGSTGGGLKMLRVIILTKQMMREFTLTLHPRAIAPMRFAGGVVPDKLIFTVVAYALLWCAVVVACSVIMVLSGLDPLTGITAVISCTINLGPGLGGVGPAGNFAGLSDFQLWLCTGCMLVGRLELTTVFILFTRDFWRV